MGAKAIDRLGLAVDPGRCLYFFVWGSVQGANKAAVSLTLQYHVLFHDRFVLSERLEYEVRWENPFFACEVRKV